MRKAIIIGHTGQDGRYLWDLLSEKEYSLIGISSNSVLSSHAKVKMSASIIDYVQIEEIIKEFQADELYYLAAVHQSSSDKQLDEGELFQSSININVKAYVNILEKVRLYSRHTRIFYAASSHIFGNTFSKTQNEDTVLNPNCIYGITKTTGIYASHYYKNEHNIFISVGIFYNHESPLRNSKYLSKKVVEAAVAIKRGTESKLIIGNIESRIDWGYAPDYVNAAYKILQIDQPDDFIVASGTTHTVKDFIIEVFNYLELDWEKYVSIDPGLITKKQKQSLAGDNQKLVQATGWKNSVTFKELIKILVDAELNKHAKK